MAQPTQEELNDLSAAAQKLWDLDDNRLIPGEDYEINLQVGKKGYENRDVAAAPLFSRVSEAVFQRKTYKSFMQLLDNYERATGVAEKVSEAEKQENSHFIDAIMETRPMKYVKEILVAKQLAQADPQAFKAMLTQMWFSLYTRDVRDDSCGFEHVFVGESKEGKIVGFHNWLQFYLEEKKGAVNYTGYLLPRGRGGQREAIDNTEQLISCQFGWDNEIKDVSSLFIGTSPEFEVALYTLCFLTGQEESILQMAGYEMKIRAYHIRSKYGDKVGSAFPELLSKVEGYTPAARPSRPQPAAPSTPPQEPYYPPAQAPQGGGGPPAGSYAQAAAGGYPPQGQQGYPPQAQQGPPPQYPPRVQETPAESSGGGLLETIFKLILGCFSGKK